MHIPTSVHLVGKSSLGFSSRSKSARNDSLVAIASWTVVLWSLRSNTALTSSSLVVAGVLRQKALDLIQTIMICMLILQENPRKQSNLNLHTRLQANPLNQARDFFD